MMEKNMNQKDGKKRETNETKEETIK